MVFFICKQEPKSRFLLICVNIHKSTHSLLLHFHRAYSLKIHIWSLIQAQNHFIYEDIFKCNIDSKYWKSNFCKIIIKWQWRTKYFHYHASLFNNNNFIKNSYNIKYSVLTIFFNPFLWIFTCFLLQLYVYHVSSVFLILLKLKDGSHKKIIGEKRSSLPM